jgi:hypothetical protein
MPVVDVEQTILSLKSKIDKTYQDIYRLQGTLSTFESFKKGGLRIIELPNEVTQNSNVDELESIQEKPE